MYVVYVQVLYMYLESISLDDSALYVVLYLPQHGKHGNVRLTGSSRSRDKEILTSVIGNIKHDGLDAI